MMAIKYFGLNVLASIAIISILFPSYHGQLIISTTSGSVEGKAITTSGINSYAYLGIPYAQPPINQLRFKPPVPVTSWNGVLNATQYQYSCPQPTPIFLSNPSSQSSQIDEDCLYLNIFTTNPSKAANMSVMVYIHGGGFEAGSAARNQIRTISANEGIVAVAMNYRLGVLGFMSSGESDINQRTIQANLGLQDQNLAIKWIRDNIENFGGNPNQITLVGQSAGGLSIAYHLVMPSSKGLFRGAIIQSAPYGVIPSYLQSALTLPPTLAFARLSFQRFSAAANCSRSTSSEILKCLQTLPIPLIIKLQSSFRQLFPILIFPIPDGSTISEPLYTAIPAGRFHQVPIMTGTTLNDGFLGVLILGNATQGLSRQRFIAVIYTTFRTANQRVKLSVVHRYTNWSNVNSPISNRDQYADLATDYAFAMPNQYFTDQFSRFIPTYTYIFAHRTKSSWQPSFVKVNHGMELPYVFGVPLDNSSNYPASFTPQEVELSRQMMSYWGSFVRNG